LRGQLKLPANIPANQQGSGKSMLTRLAQRITDPVHRPPLQPPSNDRDLVAAARNNRVLAFDNVSKLSREMADNFCRLSTALFTDHDTASFADYMARWGAFVPLRNGGRIRR
jgi:hypothetical protein